MIVLDEFSWSVPRSGFQWVETAGYPDRSAPHQKVSGRFLSDRTKRVPAPPHTTYQPLKHTGLFRRFIETKPTEKGVLHFANEFGALGGSVRIPILLPAERPPHSFYNWSGETIEGWRQEISDMRHAFSLWEWVRGGDQAELGKFIHWLGPVEEGLRSYPFGLVTYTGLPAGSSLKGFEIASERDSPQQYSSFAHRDLIGPGWCALQGVLNSKLHQHAAVPRLLPVARSKVLEPFRLHLFPVSLVSALWLQLAAAVEGNRAYAQCETCKRWFEVAAEVREDAKFCKPACRYKAYRTRKAEAKKLLAKGISIDEIAQLLNTDKTTAEGWVGR